MESGETVVLNTNEIKQPDFEGVRNNEINQLVEADIQRGINRRLKEIIKGEAVIEKGDIKDLSERISDFYLVYYEGFGIDNKKVVKPDLIYSGNTDTGHGVINLAICDTIILANEESLFSFTEDIEFTRACTLAHEQYHISSGQTVEVVVVQTKPSLEVKTNFVKSGLGMGESIYDSCLEEGMAVRMEEMVNTEVFGKLFEGHSIPETFVEDKDYEWPRKVISELEGNIPDFVRLAERARLLDEIDVLQKAIDAFYGKGIGEKLLNTVTSDSQFACEVLRKIKNGKTEGDETEGVWEKEFNERVAYVNMLRQKLGQ